jgi:hypothetical protein
MLTVHTIEEKVLQCHLLGGLGSNQLTSMFLTLIYAIVIPATNFMPATWVSMATLDHYFLIAFCLNLQ